MTPSSNPYVGPRTFSEKEAPLFFGREREARDLTARIVSERLLLFYAQSGAGKSSLLNARIIPNLRDEEGFQVLPVGRVSGELPAGAPAVDNIFAFNLMASLDQSGESPARLAGVSLSDFLARLAREHGVDADGRPAPRWVYKPELPAPNPAAAESRPAAGPRFVLIIDQFEEIITSHPGRWQEREDFFRQLNQALVGDPALWAVLTLREDYVAALDPYAESCFNRLRARFYMERMKVDAALEAIRNPADKGGRPFAPGVAEQLAHNLSQVRVPDRKDTVAGQYVEPVQLQVVCYQLWENLTARPLGSITIEDLAVAGDVDQSLAVFYENAIAGVLALPTLRVSEQQLRTWFSTQLITEAGTRGSVFRNQDRGESAGLPNTAVDVLVRQFLLRTELRAGGSWVELVHDRFIEPILRANRARQTPLALDAEKWLTAGRNPDLYYEGQKLQDALKQIERYPREHNDIERQFLRASQEEENRRKALRRARLRAVFSGLGIVIAGLVVASLVFAASAQRNAKQASEAAEQARRQAIAASTAQSQAAVAAEAEIEQRKTAEAFRAVAVDALATSEANLKVALAAQIVAVRSATPSPIRTLAGTLVGTQTPIIAPTRSSTTVPLLTVVALQTQLAQVQATQTVLDTYIVADWRGILLRSEPKSDAEVVTVVPQWERARVMDTRSDPWLLIEAADGTRGWTNEGIWRIFEGNPELLPQGLRYRVITGRSDLPFIYGKVVSHNGIEDRYELLKEPNAMADVIFSVPVGTEIIMLLTKRGKPADWSFVTLRDPYGGDLVYSGYLPTEVLAETAKFGE